MLQLRVGVGTGTNGVLIGSIRSSVDEPYVTVLVIKIDEGEKLRAVRGSITTMLNVQVAWTSATLSLTLISNV